MLSINDEMFDLIQSELQEFGLSMESISSLLEEEIKRFYIGFLLQLYIMKNKKIDIPPKLMFGGEEEEFTMLDHAHYEKNIVVVKFFDHRPSSLGVKTWRAQVKPKTKILVLDPQKGSCSVSIFGNQRIVFQADSPVPWLKLGDGDNYSCLSFHQIKNLLSCNKIYNKILYLQEV